MSRRLRALLTLAVTGLCTAYLVWRIDLSETIDVLADTELEYFAVALAIMAASVLPYAWRWQLLLRAKRIEERLAWLVRAYFVSYTAGQILPTAVGGDAVRIFETAKRHPGHGGPIAGSVLLERALGGAATLALAALGFALAVGEYDVGAYLWIELAFVVATVVAAFVMFSQRARRPLARLVPLLSRLRLERPVRAVYEGIHAYRSDVGLMLGVFALTFFVQAFRVLSIWFVAKAVDVDVSARLFYVMGPLFFLVLLVPFTVNGLAVREAFFVSFLGRVDVPPEQAFAAGFLFFLLTLVLALPGALLLLLEGGRGLLRPQKPGLR